jgi:ABC-type dipeptide/oligopeptide/nickel transport system permease component
VFRFVARRLAFTVFALWLMATTVFALLRVSPGSVERVIGGPHADARTLALIRHNLGLDRSVPAQYRSFLGGLLRGDLGYSYVNGCPVTELVADRLPTTLCLVAGAAVVSLAAGVGTGVLSAVRRDGPLDRISHGLAVVALSTPSFVMALVLLQVSSAVSARLGVSFFEVGPPLQEHFAQRMVLPVTGLGLVMAAGYSRLSRGSTLEVLAEDYIRTARAKGVPESRITRVHALRPALSPVIAQFGVDVGVLVGSTIVTEQVFGLQGIGQLVYQSIAVGDAPVIVGVALLVTFCVTIANLVVDMVHHLLDPRLRLD